MFEEILGKNLGKIVGEILESILKKKVNSKMFVVTWTKLHISI